MIAYATGIGYQRTDVMTSLLFTSTTALITIPLFSALSDRLGRRRVVMTGAVGIICYAWPLFELVNSRNLAVFYLAMVIAQVLQSLMFAPLGALLSEMFSTSVRYTGASMGYQLAALVGAGFTPLVASSLVTSEGSTFPLVAMAAGCGVVTVVGISRITETRGADLTGIGAETRPIS